MVEVEHGKEVCHHDLGLARAVEKLREREVPAGARQSVD
jgi:hypothetical protein